MAFPAIEKGHPLLPSVQEIPEDYPDRRRWLQFQRDWFFEGYFPPLLRREGIDAETAFRHLSCLQRTFGIKHQHKEAAVAWLASLWFAGFAPEQEGR